MRLSPDAIDAYFWSGNVRDPQSSIEQAVILTNSPQIMPDLSGRGDQTQVSKQPMSERADLLVSTITGPRSYALEYY